MCVCVPFALFSPFFREDSKRSTAVELEGKKENTAKHSTTTTKKKKLLFLRNGGSGFPEVLMMDTR